MSISQHDSDKENLLLFFTSLRFYTDSETHKQKHSPLPALCTGSPGVSFFILSAWAPFIFSYMSHHSFPIFALHLFHLTVYSVFLMFFLLFCWWFLFFSSILLHPCHLLQCLSSLWHSLLYSSLYHLLDGSFCDDVVWGCSSLILISLSPPFHQCPIQHTWNKNLIMQTWHKLKHIFQTKRRFEAVLWL